MRLYGPRWIRAILTFGIALGFVVSSFVSAVFNPGASLVIGVCLGILSVALVGYARGTQIDYLKDE